MAEDIFEPEFEEFLDSESDDLKKKIAEQSLKSAEQIQEDPSRSSLHYGEDEQPEDIGTASTDGSQQGSFSPQGNAVLPEESSVGANSGRAAQSEPSSPVEDSAAQTVNVAPEQAASRSKARRTGDDPDLRYDAPGTGGPIDNSPSYQPSENMEVSATARADLPPEAAGAPNEEPVDANDAPTAMELSNSAVAENVEGR